MHTRLAIRATIRLLTFGLLLGMVAPAHGQSPKRPRPILGDTLKQPADSASRLLTGVKRMKIDEEAVAAAGIRKLSSKHLTLYTDLPSSAEVDELPKVFDLAFPQWCEYFGIDPVKEADWQITGCLMKDKDTFQRGGLIPSNLPKFAHGWARNWELWLFEQPSDYYRRHLLLHEGTHAFMNTMLGACGPPWYMEGMAELLSTHSWADGKLKLNYMPVDRDEVPHWGRIRIIKKEMAERRARYLENVVEFTPYEFLENAPYAWCWAVATLMDHHPKYRERFRGLAKNVTKRDFNKLFYKLFADDWRKMSEEWQIMVTGLEYGYDVTAAAVDFADGKPLPADGAIVTLRADRGWQSTGLALEEGQRYAIRSKGRYQVADQPQVWWSEPGGVSIRYYKGRPLGKLLAAIRPDDSTGGSSPLLRPATVGLGTTLQPKQSGTLYLKINDSAAELDDNAGELKVQVKPL